MNRITYLKKQKQTRLYHDSCAISNTSTHAINHNQSYTPTHLLRINDIQQESILKSHQQVFAAINHAPSGVLSNTSICHLQSFAHKVHSTSFSPTENKHKTNTRKTHTLHKYQPTYSTRNCVYFATLGAHRVCSPFCQ